MKQNEIITVADLELFRKQLLADIRSIFATDRKVEPEQDWLKSARIRRLLDISAGTLQTLRITGKVSFRRLGGAYYYSLTELKKHFENTPTGRF